MPHREVAEAIARLYEARLGRGPIDVTVTFTDDLVVCVLENLHTPPDATAFEIGAHELAHDVRVRFQRYVSPSLTAVVELATGRTVRSHVPGYDPEVDLATDVFFLDPLPAPLTGGDGVLQVEERAGDPSPGRSTTSDAPPSTSTADDLLEALRAPDAIETSDLVVLADWLAEDVSQQLYAIRQDLAEIDPAHPRSVRARTDLLSLLRRITGISEALRGGPAGATSPGPQEPAGAEPTDAASLTARSRLLGKRNAEVRRAVEHDRARDGRGDGAG